MSSCRFLVTNGIVSTLSDSTPPVSTFLEAHPGAYTTTRTHNNASCILFWERHMRRLANSAQIIYNLKPELLFGSDTCNVVPNMSCSMNFLLWESVVQSLVNDSVKNVLPLASKEMKIGEELAITMLVSGNLGRLGDFDERVDEERISRVLDVHVHVGIYVPPVFGVRENCAYLAVVGRGRDVAAAKYSDWVRLRKSLEKLRYPSTTELLLSNDGDQILEGCLTNFFVVCFKDNIESEGNLHDYKNTYSCEVQTSPLSDGVLPGVVRQLIIELCSSKGIPFREIAPSWSQREMWEEAFITNSLRLLQHVETIQVPKSWDIMESKTWKDISWEEKRFQDGPGMITTMIQQAIMENVESEGYPVSNFLSQNGEGCKFNYDHKRAE